jgi:hypothetical protein
MAGSSAAITGLGAPGYGSFGWARLPRVPDGHNKVPCINVIGKRFVAGISGVFSLILAVAASRLYLCESVCIRGSNFLVTAAAAAVLIGMLAKEWNHRCTQMRRAACSSVGNSLDFQARLAEIEQETKPEPRCLQVVMHCWVFAV